MNLILKNFSSLDYSNICYYIILSTWKCFVVLCLFCEFHCSHTRLFCVWPVCLLCCFWRGLLGCVVVSNKCGFQQKWTCWASICEYILLWWFGCYVFSGAFYLLICVAFKVWTKYQFRLSWMRCKISTKHRGSSYRLVLLIFFSIVRFLLQVISHGERNLHSRIRNKKDSAQHKGRKHSAQHKDAKHSAHQQDNTLSSHHSVSASALSLLGDALHNGNKNQNAAFARFKEVRAPFKAGDDPSRKTNQT